MSKNISSRHGVDKTPLYKPGLPIEVVAREFGLNPNEIVKLASNENPLGPSPRAVKAIESSITELHRYPDGGAYELTKKLSEKWNLSPDNFVIGNGSNEILELLAQVYLEPGTNAVMGEFPFVVYPIVTQHFGAEIRKVPMPDYQHDLDGMLNAIDEKTRIVFIASPNNPTPAHIEKVDLEKFINRLPEHVLLCLDCAYAEYLDDPVDFSQLASEKRNVIITHTFSKIFGLAGIRIGYAYAHEEIISILKRARQPFSVNSLALEAALAALDDDEFVKKSKETNSQGIRQLKEGLLKLNLMSICGEANFILVQVPDPALVCERLLEKGVIVRSMAPFSLDGMIRVSVGSEAENEKFLQMLQIIL